MTKTKKSKPLTFRQLCKQCPRCKTAWDNEYDEYFCSNQKCNMEMTVENNFITIKYIISFSVIDGKMKNQEVLTWWADCKMTKCSSQYYDPVINQYVDFNFWLPFNMSIKTIDKLMNFV